MKATETSKKSPVKVLVLGAAVLACLLAPLWARYAAELKGRRLFLEADSLVWVGIAVVAAFAISRVLPLQLHKLVERLDAIAKKIQWLWIAVLTMGTVGLLYYTNRQVLHSFMNSADEHSCLFLAECFRLGKWWVESHPLSEFFNVVHVGNRDGKWFSVYPPGWPLIMVAGLKWGILNWLNPVLSALSIPFLFLAGRKLYHPNSVLLAITLAVLTPFFIFTGASYYSHPTCLLALSVFIYAYLRLREATTENQRIFWMTIVSVAVGYGLMTRYLTMAAIAGPFLVYHYWPVFLRRQKIQPHHWVAVVILVVFMGIIFYQNYQVTGKLHKAPNRYDKSWERLGFRDFYTPIDGLIFLLARGFYLFDWAPGIYLILYLMSFAVLKQSKRGEEHLFRWVFLLPAIAYFFYFSWGGNQYGPRYYWEGFPFMMISAMGCAHAIWTRSDGRGKTFLTLVLLISIASGFYQYQKHAVYYEEVSSQRKALYSLVDKSISKPSIVFIRGFLGQKLVMSQDDAIRNAPSLDGLVLYAKDKEGENKKLMEYYSDRQAYIGYFDRKVKEARLEPIA